MQSDISCFHIQFRPGAQSSCNPPPRSLKEVGQVVQDYPIELSSHGTQSKHIHIAVQWWLFAKKLEWRKQKRVSLNSVGYNFQRLCGNISCQWRFPIMSCGVMAGSFPEAGFFAWGFACFGSTLHTFPSVFFFSASPIFNLASKVFLAEGRFEACLAEGRFIACLAEACLAEGRFIACLAEGRFIACLDEGRFPLRIHKLEPGWMWSMGG